MLTFLTNLTLGKKITLLTTIGLLFGIGVFSTLGMRAVNQATETMLQDRLTTASLVADYVDEALGRALIELQNTTELLKVNGVKNNLESEVAALETTYSRLSIYTHRIYLLNEKGQVIWSKPKTPLIESIDISSHPSIDRTLRMGEAGVSGLVSAPVTDVPVIYLSSPTGEREPGRQGALVVAVDLAKSGIGGFVQPITLGETGYVEIIDQNGVVVARTEPGPDLAPFEKSDHSGRFATLISAGEPTRGVCHTCHESGQRVERRDVLAFVPLSNASWGVVIRQSEEEALASTRQLRQNLLLFGVGLVTVALLFVIVTTRDIGSRIRMLTSASQKIAEGDLDSPVATLGKDEVGILGLTLDDMRVKLKASYSELQQKTNELSSLLSVSEILSSTVDLSRLFDAVVAKAVEVIPGADGGALLLHDTARESLMVQCSVGLDQSAISKFALTPDGQPGSGLLLKPSDGQEKATLPEAITEFLQSTAWHSEIQSSICGQVFQQSRNIGSLILVSFTDGQAFSESERRLLQAIADSIGIAIERGQLAKEAEEARALHEADRLRSHFISSVSHELRTPLTLIKGYSTSLLRQDASWDEETRREFLQVIDEKTDELRELIDKVLQSAKLEAGALKLEKEPLLIPRLAKKVVEELTPRTKKHKFGLEFTPSFPVVEADARCIEQVVRNLVENAIKYSPEGDKIDIAGEVKGDKVIISVSDNGIGIPREQRDKIFERFYRVNSPLTHGATGSGLGLSIVKGHVEVHGGEVWLESTAGKGSKFYFSLPLSNADENE